MTWLKSDSGHKMTNDPLSKRGRVQVPAAPVTPQELLDAEGEPTCSVFEAMGIGVDGQGIWGENTSDRFPADVERELMKEHGWPTKRQWDLTRRIVFRDTEAV